MLFLFFVLSIFACALAQKYPFNQEYFVLCQGKFVDCELTNGRSSPSVSHAYGTYIDDVDKDGWGKIWVHGDDTEQGWYQAGFLEGALTSLRVYQHFTSWYEFQFGAKPPSEKTSKFMLDQFAFAKKLSSQNDEYSMTLRKVLLQFEGLLAGVNHAAADTSQQLTLLQLLLLNAAGDLYDIIPAVDSNGFNLHIGRLDAETFFDQWHRQISCSALIRIVPDYSDIFAGHNTWTSYQNMLRIFKHYSLDNGKLQSAHSSKPGMVYSKDDFYALPRSKLVVMETTNGVMDKSVYANVTYQSLLTWQRVPIANTLADNAENWVDIMTRYNSGTYANQWMALDLKQFSGAHSKNLLYILEVAPGIAVKNDVTDILLGRGFWPSYNVPYDKSVYQLTGFQTAYETYGDAYSYEKCPRAQIFARDAPEVKDFGDMQRLMRKNDYNNDPLSLSEPANAVASRYDLRTNSSKAKSYGAVDAKLTSLQRINSILSNNNVHLVVAQNGPTHDQQPVFQWSTSLFSQQLHLGQPDKFDFDFVDMDFFAH